MLDNGEKVMWKYLITNGHVVGDWSFLDKSIECPEGHNFENKVPGYSVFMVETEMKNTQKH